MDRGGRLSAARGAIHNAPGGDAGVTGDPQRGGDELSLMEMEAPPPRRARPGRSLKRYEDGSWSERGHEDQLAKRRIRTFRMRPTAQNENMVDDPP